MWAETSWQPAPLKRSPFQLGWLAVFFACAFVLVALIGYGPGDPTLISPGPGDVTNPCGPVGANLADVLFQGVGYGAWSVFLGMVASVLALAGRPLQPVHEWILFAVGLTGACGVIATVFTDPSAYPAGGALGQIVVNNLTPLLGTVGTLLVCTSVSVFCLVAVFRISLRQIAARSVAAGENMLSWSGRAVGGALARSLQGPAEEAWPTPESVWPREPDRPALPVWGRRRSPVPLPPPRPVAAEPAVDTPLLPLVDPGAADVVFETTDPSEYDRRGSPLLTPRRRRSQRSDSLRDGDSVLQLFPALGPRNPGRGARMGIVPTPSGPPSGAGIDERVVQALTGLRLYGRVTQVWEGPVVTTVGIRPERHLEPKAIVDKQSALADALGVPAVRVVPWDGTRDVGIQVPTYPRQPIALHTVLAARPEVGNQMPVGMGVDERGNPVFADLETMSHLVVLGADGRGNALRTMVESAMERPPRRGLGLVLVTPDAELFAPYESRTALVQPVVRRARVAVAVLKGVLREVERRRLAATPRGATPRDRVLLGAGPRVRSSRQAHWLVVLDRFDELAAKASRLMPTLSRVIEHGAAVGVHVIVASKRPLPLSGRPDDAGRLVFTQASPEASKEALGIAGAETLLGQGDALWLQPDGVLTRVHVPDAGADRAPPWRPPLRSG
ncbi:MAG: DNA translocase FtsK 4TM domain-containing protein [Myxococcota bacterium]